MLTTVCYLQRDNKYLMLYRNKKKIDVNKGKWIGVGGKLEEGESPEECIKREIKEETGYTANNCKERGIVVFNYNDEPSEFMYLYTCNDFTGNIIDCDEGDLKWIPKDEVKELNLWEGDKIFIDLIQNKAPYFFLTLNYKNDELISHTLEFKKDDFMRFEVFVPEEYIDSIIKELSKYNLLTVGFYKDVYASMDVEGHWISLEGADPFDGEIGKESKVDEKLLKFIIKKEFADLAYYLIKRAHPYEVPVINIF